jgi:hypothetical protein
MVDDRKGLWVLVCGKFRDPEERGRSQGNGLDRALLSDSDYNLRNRTRGGVRTLLGGSPLHRRSGPHGPARYLETGLSVTSSVYQTVIRQLTDNKTFQEPDPAAYRCTV